MNFDIDVLVIYSDHDNEPRGKNNLEWVTMFRKFLELMLIQVLGSKPNILLKSESDTLVAPKMDNVATLVPVLSPDFINSGRCLDNLEAFYKATESGGQYSTRF